MARPESVAVAGYFPTPPRVIPMIASLLKLMGDRPDRQSWEQRPEFTFMDPCAGDGEALSEIVKHLVPERSDYSRVKFLTVEMEATRHAGLRERLNAFGWHSSERALHADAFCVTASRKGRAGVSVLFLNPPYDIDREYGRLEQKFLSRFSPLLMDDGILLFLVPFYALAASAQTIAQEFSDLQCFRLPEPEWDAYRQVLLVAKKTSTLLSPDPTIVATVQAWAADAESIPVLPLATFGAPYTVPGSTNAGLEEWTVRNLDVTALMLKSKPWMQSDRAGKLVPVSGVLPEIPVQDLLLRKYPLATPPRPAHIAAGIASGIFNGSRVEPNKGKDRLPSLLVKGVFDREYKTIEEKKNKDGEVRGVVQVQQPKLVTTVLDLSTHKYHVLRGGTEASNGDVDVATMTVSDLLAHYGDSLMSVMESQCPILYDPRKDADQIPLPTYARKPFTAQGHAVRALIRLLGGPTATKRSRQGKAAILLGEIGSGKSTVSLMTAATINSKRILVMCPPHLLTSWTNEVAAVLPDAEVRILQSVSDVDAIAAVPQDKTIVAVLSRETGKLGHAWGGIDGSCPKCGSKLLSSAAEAAKKRLYCESRKLIPASQIARDVREFAYKLLPYAPTDHRVGSVLRGRFDEQRIKHYSAKPKTGAPVVDGAWVDGVVDHVADALIAGDIADDAAFKALVALSIAFYDENRIVRVAKKLVESSTDDYSRVRGVGRDLLWLLPPDSDLQKSTVESLRSAETKSYYSPWEGFTRGVAAMVRGEAPNWNMKFKFVAGALINDETPAGSMRAIIEALGALTSVSSWRQGRECGEPLFQALAEPRRIPLARYISKHHPSTFDFLVLDEGHEYATDGSAQERSAHRLSGLGLPTILMTGSIMNGYAESLFTNMWALSADFRREFDRDEKQRFVDRYGYRKRLVEEKDRKTGEVVAYGSMTDRVETSEKVIGNAPGVLPLFLLRHLLPISVTLHKADLAIDLPPCRQIRSTIAVDPELMARYRGLEAALIRQIRKDQFEPGLAGRLWGQLAELPSYLDRATSDTGNSPDGAYEIRYPESCGGQVVARQEPLPADHILAKEEWMLDLVERKLAEGVNVMVFSWHVALLPRIQRLLEARLGEKVPVLYADKVATGKRQDWIDREVIKKKRHVLVTNPVAIQTGLNNLVHFAAEVWMENPACNPIIYRQAIGRIDRIGQKRPTDVYFPIYEGTLQTQLYDLLLRKVAVSVSTDGLDPESALAAAGVVEDDYLTGLSIGKQLYAMYQEGALLDEVPVRRRKLR